ncbi:hypothetical protein GE115_08720 [Agromyces sp. CFH 90414]|uniref:Glycosyltransferase RgtA/B/C/D-like domain-containing protein n=1 Tax=Agromyces agglutinans TaxID=2662258 RepID=A0A6I2FB45_9MICO|nr:glycosyltransferase family 39 protein [Agromyces agglutinans]MRG59950.1 hypothetical protein [Agromyces agglutinans]
MSDAVTTDRSALSGSLSPGGPAAAAPPPAPLAPPARFAPFARGPVLAAMAALGVLLAATSNGYGFHRDELYFRMLEPAWGYVDQPPLTPLIARTITSLVDEPWALRIPAILAAGATVLVLALIAREAGGGRLAQSLAAWGGASAASPMVFGHVFLTASIDLVVWPLVALFTMRALLRGDGRWWLAAGLVTGLATYNKWLVVMLVVGIGIGLLALGPWRALRSPWLWAGVGLAIVLALPNLAYQVANELPQLRMGAALAEDTDGEGRILTVPFLFLHVGPLLAPIWITGLVALFRRPPWRDIRLFAIAFAFVVVATIAGGAQPFYPLGIVEILFALGAVPAAEWMRTRVRRVLVWTAVALNAVVAALIALPLLPVALVDATPWAGANPATGDTIGWPAYVEQIAGVVNGSDASRPPIIVASNYGEAGALDRYGPEFGIDPETVFSGHNALWFQSQPPDSAVDVVFVGEISPRLASEFESCRTEARLDHGADVDNEEQGLPVIRCTGLTAGWDDLWPRLAHLS